MRAKIGDGGVPNSHASVMQRVRNKNNMAELNMKTQIADYERHLSMTTMHINLEMMDLQKFMSQLRDCFSDDLSEFAPRFQEKYNLVHQYNDRVKRTKLRDLFTDSEIGCKTPKTRSVYTSSPSKSLVRSQTLPIITSSSIDRSALDRSISNLDSLARQGHTSPDKRSMGHKSHSPTKAFGRDQPLPDLVEEPTPPTTSSPRPNTRHKAKRMGIITEVEYEEAPKSGTRLPVIQMDAWGINPSDERVKQTEAARVTSGGLKAVSPGALLSASRTQQGNTGAGGVDLMRSMLDHKPRKKRRRRKKPINTRIEEFFENLEQLLAVASVDLQPSEGGDDRDRTPPPVVLGAGRRTEPPGMKPQQQRPAGVEKKGVMLPAIG